jgi:hypothetical protein
MNITIPVYIQEIKTDKSAPPLYTVRPLFFEAPVERDEVLKRAMNKLARSLRRYFDYLP